MAKYSLGYTAGAYDLFHIGHLKILRVAKSMCDHLIVAVSTDELVKKIKKKKPAVPFPERCEILRSIKYVDSVIPQNSMDKIEALNRLNFDVIFVGDDHFGENDWINYEDTGLEVVYIPHTKGLSTTAIVEKIKHDT